MITQNIIKSDIVGAVASGLCVVHCLATPFLFVVQSSITESCSHVSPIWWSAIDFIFIVITFFAVRQSGRNSSKPWMMQALYITWGVLSILVINEKMGLLSLSSYLKYTAALTLIFLHLYNLKFCQCDGDQCCAT